MTLVCAPHDGIAAGIYLHFPFCAERCTYCDFPTVAGQDRWIEPYLQALEREILSFQPDLAVAVDSVYLGGGTPSRMTPPQVGRILGTLRRRFHLEPGCEITLEANPESVTDAKLPGYTDAGVNRISIGAQSLDDRVLRKVGRAHDAACAISAVRRARAAGFREVSVDLIAGLPGEDLSCWASTVRRAAALEPDHVSVYLLETDKDTPLARSMRAGRSAPADEDALALAYEETVATLETLGFHLYEISNFARPGHESRHNRKYWTDAPYGGFGLGAHAYSQGARRANRRDLMGYLSDLAAGRDPVVWRDPWDPGRRLGEALVLGLRLREGVDLERLGARYAVDLQELHAAAWERALEAGLVEREGACVRLTPHGRLYSNDLFAELI